MSSTAYVPARQRATVKTRARIRTAGIATVAAGITRAVIATCVAPTRTRVPPVAPARAARLAILCSLLAAAALAAGCRVLSGLDLLLAQAVRQFELFTGVPAPVARMRQALRER